jgi:predicted RNA-binding protein with PIN domain
MAILIDGYNLLHATGILGRNIGPGTLERARNALLSFLAASLTDSQRASTTVVFDAKDGPPGLPRELHQHGMRVLYAVRHRDADDLLKELIGADSSPRRLVVVSSDHQVQRVARRRRATPVDSDRWYGDVCRQRKAREQAEPVVGDKPIPHEIVTESADWIRTFSESLDADNAEGASGGSSDRDGLGEPRDRDPGLTNPFPPGYAEDLLADENEDR